MVFRIEFFQRALSDYKKMMTVEVCIIQFIYTSIFQKKQEYILPKKNSEKKYVWLIIIEADDYNKGRKKKKEVLNKTSLLKAAKGFIILEEKINEYFKS